MEMNLETAVLDFLKVFTAWQEADGWDNPEWDYVIDAVENLQTLTGGNVPYQEQPEDGP